MSAGRQIIVHRVRILIVGFSAMTWYLAPTVAPRSIQRCQADRSVATGIIEEQMVRCLAGGAAAPWPAFRVNLVGTIPDGRGGT